MEEIFIPASGMAGEDVLVTEWLKEPGEEVAAGEPVAVVETDKATVELSGTTPGRLSRHLVQAGDRVPGGTTVAFLLAAGELEPGAAPDGSAGPAVAATSLSPSAAAVPTGPAADVGAEQRSSLDSERQPDGRHTLSPRQRRALAGVAAGAGPDSDGHDGATGHRVPVSASAVAPVSPAPVSPARVSPAPVNPAPSQPAVAMERPGDSSSNRQATAALVSESWRSMPHFSVGRDVRVDGLQEAVSAARANGTSVTVTDFLALALARALVSLGEPSDIGLAVATDWGVLIPVLRSIAGRSLDDVAIVRQAAVGRARLRRLDSADATPVFATLSNLGPSGVTWFTGVVPLNQAALLTIGEVSLRPAVEGRGLVVAPMMTAVVTADHRRYDGVDSANLLSSFVDNLTQLIVEGQK
jgi:pyruvate dehydrogenase E2 component (dihydrolipoamide acetyltransferase)